jgi:hypothetical protein
MPTAGWLLELYSLRLKMNRLAPGIRPAVERFVENLKNLAPDESVEIVADINRDPIARFVRTATGEVIGEINKLPEIDSTPP